MDCSESPILSNELKKQHWKTLEAWENGQEYEKWKQLTENSKNENEIYNSHCIGLNFWIGWNWSEKWKLEFHPFDPHLYLIRRE